MSESARRTAAQSARQLLEQQPIWHKARAILFYAPIRGELDLWDLMRDAISAGKIAVLPRFDSAKAAYAACRIREMEADIVSGKFGVREPRPGGEEIALNRLDLLLVPGIAFDRHGRRLGRGMGYYDRLLAGARGAACGVAYDEQIVDDIPVEEHDVPMNFLLTPTRWLTF